MRHILLTIEYDGTGFSGWQRQPNQRTVQGEVERVLSVLCAMPVQIAGTSRTDAGVHAYGQRAGFSGDFRIPTERIKEAANHLLSGNGRFRGVGEIRIRKAEEVPAEFHPRFDAVGKTYVYRIRCGGEADPFQRNYTYQIPRRLNLDEMKGAAGYFVGTHDFRSLMAAGGKEMEDTVRTIYGLSVSQSAGLTAGQGDQIELQVTGNGFLYNMVRILTGTLVEVGSGKKRAEEIPGLLQSLDRRQAGHTAPPQGLYLDEIYYDPQPMMARATGGDRC